MITQERLKEVLHYNAATGVFTWKIKPAIYRHKGDKAGFVHTDGYVRIMIRCKQYLAHRLAWLYTYGVAPIGHVTVINGIKHDYRLCNLRNKHMRAKRYQTIKDICKNLNSHQESNQGAT